MIQDAPEQAGASSGQEPRPNKADSWIQSWNPYHPDKLDKRPLQPIEVEESQIRKKAARYFLIAFVVFLVWAFLAPIDAGVTVPGNVVVAGYRKSVQHPSGGVVRKINVKEGDNVTEGDVIVEINPLNSEANLSTIELQYLNALVTEARLKAERLGAAAIAWPAELGRITDAAQVREAKAIQGQLFQARRTEYRQTLSARRAQLASLTEEQQSLDQLAREGYVPRALAAQAMRTRLETETAINTYISTYQKQVETELADIQKNRDAYQGRYEAAKFDRNLSEIKAPASGTIVGLKVYTVGGVITSGQVLAEILPRNGKLVVEAKIPANLIDKVRVGLQADTHFTAFNASTTPTVPGVVQLVGVDRVVPDRTKPGEPDYEYYLAQIEITPEGRAMIANLNIQPGMPADVVVKTGERNFVSYLLKPLSDKMLRAFKD